jgi:small conductance mechanosensitive channel
MNTIHTHINNHIDTHALELALVILSILTLTVILERLVTRALEKLEQFSATRRHFDPAHYRFVKHFLSGIIYFVGIALSISIIPPLKNIALSVLASSGVLAIIVGFASQQAFSNIVSGIFLGIFRPFVIGNRIKLVKEKVEGIVEDITLRHTIIKTSENRHIMVPNAMINSEIIENSNWVDDTIRKYLEIPVNYAADLTKTLQLIRQILEQHSLCLDIRTPEQKKAGESPVEVVITKYTPSHIVIRAGVWVQGERQGYILASDSYKKIKEVFQDEHIPFAKCYCERDQANAR